MMGGGNTEKGRGRRGVNVGEERGKRGEVGRWGRRGGRRERGNKREDTKRMTDLGRSAGFLYTSLSRKLVTTSKHTTAWISSLMLLQVQWNQSNAVTWVPKIFGLTRQVAALQKTSLKRSCEALV